jgi:hypothetical protein
MTQAHATQKGAIGLELGDEKGSKEMIDAPMLKQVYTRSISPWPFVRLTLGPRQRRQFRWRELQAFSFQQCLEENEYDLMNPHDHGGTCKFTRNGWLWTLQ